MWIYVFMSLGRYLGVNFWTEKYQIFWSFSPSEKANTKYRKWCDNGYDSAAH